MPTCSRGEVKKRKKTFSHPLGDADAVGSQDGQGAGAHNRGGAADAGACAAERSITS